MAMAAPDPLARAGELSSQSNARRTFASVRELGSRLPGDLLQIQVEDNGAGIAPERLAEIRTLLASDSGDTVIGEGGYGISNVNQRIKLYYGEEYGLSIDSEYRHGTRVTLVIPLQRVPVYRGALALGT